MTLLATLVFVAQALSALAVGWTSDYLVALGRDEGAVRKILLAAGAAGLAVSIFGTVSASSAVGMSVWLVAAGIFQGVKTGNVMAVAQMFAGPRSAGTWVGVQNTLANFAGILCPVITGLIIDRTGSYTSAFVINSAVAAVAAVWWIAVVPKVSQVELD
jgi:sugar phosphate permease